MRLMLVLAAVSTMNSCSPTSAAQEWWHGTFVASGSATCENDSTVTYSAETVDPHEASCTVSETTRVRVLDAVILDLTCTYEGEEGFKERHLLMKRGEKQITRYPDLMTLDRCPLAEVAADQPADRCQWNDQIWRATTNGGATQDLRFDEGATGGKATITEYRDGQPAWIATGEWGCSNGAVICTLDFQGMSSEDTFSPAFEIVRVAPNEMIVAPTFSQMVYLAERHATLSGFKYSGLKVDWTGRFLPQEDELITPENVYVYRACAGN